MVDIVKENYKRLKKASFYKHILDRLAYLSLVADIGIATATLVSLHVYSSNIHLILKWLQYALSGIVIITVFVFALFAVESNYHKKMMVLLAQVGKSVRRKRRSRKSGMSKKV